MDRNKQIFFSKKQSKNVCQLNNFPFSLKLRSILFSVLVVEIERLMFLIKNMSLLGWRHSFFTFHFIMARDRERKNNVKSINNLGIDSKANIKYTSFMCAQKKAPLYQFGCEENGEKKCSGQQWHQQKERERESRRKRNFFFSLFSFRHFAVISLLFARICVQIIILHESSVHNVLWLWLWLYGSGTSKCSKHLMLINNVRHGDARKQCQYICRSEKKRANKLEGEREKESECCT